MDIEKLNPEQKQAVTHGNGPLLIVAGAGTGKTTVITHRIAWLIEQGLAKPDQILALTFTDKAAGEMEERVDKLLPMGYVDLWVMTFHSFCEQILKKHALDIGLSNDFKLLNQTEQWMLVRQNLDKFNLDYYRPLGNPTKFIHALIQHFSRCKDEDIRPQDYLDYAEGLKVDLDGMEAGGGNKIQDTRYKIQKNSKIQIPRSKQITNHKSQIRDNIDESEIRRLEEVANSYHVYQQLLLDNNSLDFGDLINYTLRLFRRRPHILKFYQHKFKYILVDEFQDTNWAQYELVKLLADDKANLTVVGDDDQCLPGNALIDLPQGRKKIKHIKVGEQVVTAVGKGHLGVQKVIKKFSYKKRKKLLTIKTEGGQKISLTDNHKIFCFVPREASKNYHYVYLMHRQDVGWRIGVTNNLIARLRLERSAEKILAIRTFHSDEDARYYETLWSLKYGIPTSYFKERDGVVIKDGKLKDLYQRLDVDENVRNLADDFGIDLNSYHHCLEAVSRGSSKRIKISLILCHRKCRSKDHVKRQNIIMYNPFITHLLHLQTSNQDIIKKLKLHNFKLKPAKHGQRLRVASHDLKYIGELAEKIQKITGGIIESKFNLGKINYQHLPALVIPAKNLVKGFYLPVRKKNEVIYQRVIDIKSKCINQTTYDLEVDRTHNFIADNIVVHNSVYKFRGASVSNIIQFKDDYPDSDEICLVKNYRSTQNILDLAYNFIQLNNPERLEIKLSQGGKNKLSKKLAAQTKDQGEIEHIHLDTSQNEVEAVVNKIIELYNQENKTRDTRYKKIPISNSQITNSQISWNDFAILIRANSMAEPFSLALEQAKIPYIFMASKGLYAKPMVMDIIAYLKVIDSYHESRALFRILNWPLYNLDPKVISSIGYLARKKSWSFYKAMKASPAELKLSQPNYQTIGKILSLVDRGSVMAKSNSTSQIVLDFLSASGWESYLLKIDTQSSRDRLRNINQFYKVIQEFEQSFDDKSVKNFLEQIEMEIESGETGNLIPEIDQGPDAVKIMTIHAAKGLEFKYVFVVNLVDKRFPTIERRDPIELPDELVKEIIPKGDIHLQEERRLFYVAITRAKGGLFLTSADDYGGSRQKKPSRFLFETNLVRTGQRDSKNKTATKAIGAVKAITNKSTASNAVTPSKFSFTQIKAYEICPYQYKLAHIFKIPIAGKPSFSFGKTMHSTLQQFFLSLADKQGIVQADLFGSNSAQAIAGTRIDTDKRLPNLDQLLKIYEQSWIDDWYENENQKQQYFKKGRQILKDFYALTKDNIPPVKFLERGFNFKLDDYSIKGVIDRVDQMSDGSLEIIDYKTGSVKTKKNIEKDQLLIYQLAATQIFDKKVSKLTFYYLNENKPVSFLGTEKELAKQKEKILEIIEGIKSGDFEATPSQFSCKYCDFNSICEFKTTN